MSDAAPAAGAGPILAATNLHKRFTEGSGASRLDVAVLQGVDLAVQRGETVAIVGASGSGKSTLLHLLGGLEAPTQGKVELAGRDFVHMGAAEQGEWRNRHLGFIYQFHHLLPEFTALDNVAMPLRVRRVAVGEARERAAACSHRWAWPRAPGTGPAAVGRRTPARRDRARAGRCARMRAGRRADRQPRSRHRRHRVRADARPRAQAVDVARPGHPRRDPGAALRPAAALTQGRLAT
jgi:ABC-type sugar transport system ATPase subunit